MNTKNRSNFTQTIVMIVVALLMIFVSTNAIVSAQLEGEDGQEIGSPENNIQIDPVPGGPGFIMVTPYEFVPVLPSMQYRFLDQQLGVYNPSASLETRMRAGVALPHGARITQLTLYYLDFTDPGYITLSLQKADTAGIPNLIAFVYSSGYSTQPGYSSVTVNSLTPVDNQNFGYFVEIILPPGPITYYYVTSVRIDYAYSNNLPLVGK